MSIFARLHNSFLAVHLVPLSVEILKVPYVCILLFYVVHTITYARVQQLK